jgi:hypothetical protein
MGVRNRLADMPSYKTAAAMADSGSTPLRASGKLQSAKIAIAAGEEWSFVRGVRFDEVATGGMR